MKSATYITFGLLFCFSQCPPCLIADDIKAHEIFVILHNRIEQSDKSHNQINTIAADVKVAIQNMNMMDENLSGLDSRNLRFESQRTISALSKRNDFNTSNPSDLADPVIECISLYLEKIQDLIDPDWEWEDVSVHNVSPPQGVPFSMPGKNQMHGSRLSTINATHWN